MTHILQDSIDNNRATTELRKPWDYIGLHKTPPWNCTPYWESVHLTRDHSRARAGSEGGP